MSDKGYITSAWLVLLLALLFGGALAGMEVLVSERIAENKLRETLSQVPQLVPDAKRGEAYELDGKLYYEALDGDQRVGWVIPTAATGFADTIELLIGVDAQVTKITGLYVLSQKETPGLGARISEDAWRAQFQGKATAAPLGVTKTASPKANEIRAITGATISSKTVADLVNATIASVRVPLNNAGE